MELVRGIPITDYCDREQLSIPERLELFVLVCRAVQHAHQKGIIHRDLKPSNILVTVIDGAAVPKIIDFGVAKATGASLTERTLYTGFHQFVGTPLYMSPEQADLSGMDMDTRSDIYSLGVLLYELLTGTTPFDQETFRTAAFDEMRRIIREEEPPKPSTRLSSLGATRTTVSANRKADARHLDRTVRGELDWIVMKALEKDRRRRYETANDFAADVMRYLTDQPVEACPPSAWYRFGKFARRNRIGLLTTCLVAMALVAGTVVSVWQAMRAGRAEAEARLSQEDTQLVVKSLINDVIGAAAPAEAKGQPVRVIELLRKAEETLPSRFRGRPIAEAAFRQALAEAYAGLGHGAESEQQIRRAVEIRNGHLGPVHRETLRAQAFLFGLLHWYGTTTRPKLEEGIRLGRWLLEVQQRILGPDHQECRGTLGGLVNAYMQHGDFGEAREILERILNEQITVLGEESPEAVGTRRGLAAAWHALGRLDLAEEHLRRAFDIEKRHFGMRHPGTLADLRSLGLVLQDQGRIDEAVAALQEAVAGMRDLYGPLFSGNRTLCGELVYALREQGNWVTIRELCEGWIRDILVLPPEPDPVIRYLWMVTLSCQAFWLSTLPPDVPFDAELALRAAGLAAEQGNDTNDSNWTRLSLLHLRLGHADKAEWAIKEGMPRRKRGDRFDWLARALIFARGGDIEHARVWYDRAQAAGDDGYAPGVGYAETRDAVATSLGLMPGPRKRLHRGPSELRDEGNSGLGGLRFMD